MKLVSGHVNIPLIGGCRFQFQPKNRLFTARQWNVCDWREFHEGAEFVPVEKGEGCDFSAGKLEAEEIALTLLAESGWDLFEIAGEAESVIVKEGGSTWSEELGQSLARLDQVACGPRRRPFQVQPAPAG